MLLNVDIARANIAQYIHTAKNDLTVFGKDLDWENNNWKKARINFSNSECTSRVLTHETTMAEPFLSFAKAYLRTSQGLKPAKAMREISALKCVEFVLRKRYEKPRPEDISNTVLDDAAQHGIERYTPTVAYAVGRELARLGVEIESLKLSAYRIDWTNPVTRVTHLSARTGPEAKAHRDSRMPCTEALDALAEIFAANPVHPRDILTSSTMALLSGAPFRISQALALYVDCETTERRNNGEPAYGLLAPSSKLADIHTKWVPTVMWPIVQESLRRIRGMTDEGMVVDSILSNVGTSRPALDFILRHPTTLRIRVKHVPDLMCGDL